MASADFRETSPSSDPLDDAFIINLIEAVQRNPCVYNRYDPLHKITDYKHEVWRLIATETDYDGQPVELERKWRHMRDKYVRLRKQDRLQSPLKKNNKWYNYYQKMSFLDPYVEHRNRKRTKHDDVDVRNEVSDEDEYDNHVEISNAQAFTQIYESLLKSENISIEPVEVKPLASSDISCSPSSSSPSLMVQSKKEGSSKRKRRLDDEDDDDEEESEVSLFVRSIAKSLSSMDKRTFSKTRIEISKVLYDCQFGDE